MGPNPRGPGGSREGVRTRRPCGLIPHSLEGFQPRSFDLGLVGTLREKNNSCLHESLPGCWAQDDLNVPRVCVTVGKIFNTTYEGFSSFCPSSPYHPPALFGTLDSRQIRGLHLRARPSPSSWFSLFTWISEARDTGSGSSSFSHIYFPRLLS